MTPTDPGPSWGLCLQTPVVLGRLVQWGSEDRAPARVLDSLISLAYIPIYNCLVYRVTATLQLEITYKFYKHTI